MSENEHFGGGRRADLYMEEHDSPAVSSPAAIEFEVPVRDISTGPGAVSGVVVASGAGPDKKSKSAALTVLELVSELEGYIEVGPAKQGIQGMVNTVTGGALKVQPGKGEQGARTHAALLLKDEEVVRQATWTRAVSILVANKKGNAGKTPVSISLGGTIASIRGGSLAVMEVSDDRGQLTYRSEGSPMLGIGELVEAAATIESKGQLEGYTAPQTSFASIIGSTDGWREPLNRAAVVDVAKVIDRYYSIRVMDSGNQYSSSAFAGAIETADALVIPTMNSADSIFDAVELLEFLQGHEDPRARALAKTAVVIRLSDGRPEIKVERHLKFLFDAGVDPSRVYSVPFDSHIADRGQLTLSKLAPATRHAFTHAAAGVIRQLQLSVNRRKAN